MKKDTSYTYKSAEVNLEEGTVTEYLKEGIFVHNLWDVLKELESNGQQDISIKSNKSVDGKPDGEMND